MISTTAASAYFEQRESLQRGGEKLIKVLHSEEDKNFVDTFKIGTDGWQDRIEQKSFSNLEAAKSYFHSDARSFKPSKFVAQKRSSRNGVAVWEVKHQWNADWELQYTEWVRANLDTAFFVKYQLETDCADVAFSVRWIFARIHGLPATAVLAGSGKLFSQDNGKASWASIPTSEVWHEDQRFRTALNYVRNNTYTHSLIHDSYPVEINPLGVTAGGYHLTIRTQSGHTRLIDFTKPEGSGSKAIHFVASDVPAKIRHLKPEYFAIKVALTPEEGGLLRFRWPILINGVYQLLPRERMPHFSMEQYEGDFLVNFYKAVTSRMGTAGKPEELLQVHMDAAWTKLNYRVGIVNDGYAFCSVNDCDPSSINYDDWSTPSRDQQIYEAVTDIFDILNENYSDPAVNNEFMQWANLTLEYSPGSTLSFTDLLNVWSSKNYSSDPRDPVWKRWGQDDY